MIASVLQEQTRRFEHKEVHGENCVVVHYPRRHRSRQVLARLGLAAASNYQLMQQYGTRTVADP
jgi:hypothetical protein